MLLTSVLGFSIDVNTRPVGTMSGRLIGTAHMRFVTTKTPWIKMVGMQRQRTDVNNQDF
jgi:hypothetical protein